MYSRGEQASLAVEKHLLLGRRAGKVKGKRRRKKKRSTVGRVEWCPPLRGVNITENRKRHISIT